MAMRRCAGGSTVTSVPPMKIRPPETCSRPAIRRSVVDLPQPDGPSSTTSDAAAASKLTVATAGVAPQTLLTFRTEICDTGSPRERPVTMPVNHCIVKPVRRPGGACDILYLEHRPRHDLDPGQPVPGRHLGRGFRATGIPAAFSGRW